jgi:hypothetical protein
MGPGASVWGEDDEEDKRVADGRRTAGCKPATSNPASGSAAGAADAEARQHEEERASSTRGRCRAAAERIAESRA